MSHNKLKSFLAVKIFQRGRGERKNRKEQKASTQQSVSFQLSEGDVIFDDSLHS